MSSNYFLHVLTEKGLRHVLHDNGDHPEVVQKVRQELNRRGFSDGATVRRQRERDGYEKDQ